MQISFHGAARTVTGTKNIITTPNGDQILLDCGLFQGGGQETYEMNAQFGFMAKDIKAMILSHAHIDHSGLIPKLVKEGFNKPIYCTPATRDLTEILLMDSAKIQSEDVYFSNKRRALKGEPLIKPLYDIQDVMEALKLFITKEINQEFIVTEEAKCMFTEAGHILGSAVVNLTIKENNKDTHITFTGDIGRYNDPILISPNVFPQADYIICESTYGDRLHDDLAMSENDLLEEIYRTCIKKKGNLIIPSFSVGRTQEIVYALNRLDIENKLPDIKFFVDSPLSSKATEVTEMHPECYNKEMKDYLDQDPHPFDFKNLTYITEAEESKKLNHLKEPCVIISASGMADSGRVKHHIALNIEYPKNTILFVGYCEPNTIGGRLLRGTQDIKIFRDYYPVNAEIKKISSFSAHGDYNDIIKFLSCQDPKKVKKFFIVHGEYKSQLVFKERLQEKGYKDIEIPERHQTYIIN